MCDTLIANPHSHSAAGQASAAMVARVRARVLAHFHCDERTHECVFTSGATAALQLVGECFPWCVGGEYSYIDGSTALRDICETPSLASHAAFARCTHFGTRCARAGDTEWGAPSQRVGRHARASCGAVCSSRGACGCCAVPLCHVGCALHKHSTCRRSPITRFT